MFPVGSAPKAAAVSRSVESPGEPTPIDQDRPLSRMPLVIAVDLAPSPRVGSVVHDRKDLGADRLAEQRSEIRSVPDELVRLGPVSERLVRKISGHAGGKENREFAGRVARRAACRARSAQPSGRPRA